MQLRYMFAKDVPGRQQKQQNEKQQQEQWVHRQGQAAACNSGKHVRPI
jgi:hypothetical protein